MDLLTALLTLCTAVQRVIWSDLRDLAEVSLPPLLPYIPLRYPQFLLRNESFLTKPCVCGRTVLMEPWLSRRELVRLSSSPLQPLAGAAHAHWCLQSGSKKFWYLYLLPFPLTACVL